MAKRSKLDHLPYPIKAELIEKILMGAMSYENLSQWLLDKHGLNASPSVVWRFAQTILTRHRPLVELGIPLKTVAGHSDELDELGAYLVQQMILAKIIEEKLAAIFAAYPATEAANEQG